MRGITASARHGRKGEIALALMMVMALALMALTLMALTLMAAPASAAPDASKPGLSRTAAAASAEAAASEPASLAAGVSLDVSVTPEDVKLGDEVHYTVTMRAPNGVRLYFPDDLTLGDFHVVPGSRRETRKVEGALTVTTVSLTLRVYRLGFRKIPAIEVPILGPNGETGTITVPKQRVRVRGRLVSESEPTLAAPGPPMPVVTTNWTLIWGLVVFASVVVTAILTILVLWLLRGRSLRVVPPPPPRPAHEIALEKLSAIERERLPEKGEMMAYYVRISEAVREYFGNRYAFDGLVLTTTELLAELTGQDLNDVPTARIRSFLEECDLVKFASFDPTEKEIEWLLATAYSLVRETMQEERQEEAEKVEETKPKVHTATPFVRAFAWSVDFAALSLPVAVLLVLARLFELSSLYGVAGGLAVLLLLLRDLPHVGSLGKALTGLELRAAREGDRLTAARRVRRNVIHLVPFVGQTLELVVAAFDEDGRGLGDRLGGTRVIDTRSGRGDVGAIVGSVIALAVAGFLLGVLPFVVL